MYFLLGFKNYLKKLNNEFFLFYVLMVRVRYEDLFYAEICEDLSSTELELLYLIFNAVIVK